MTKVAWSRDGDQWVGKLNLGALGKMEARITEYCGALGSEFMVQVRGSHVGSAGGGTPKDALARAKRIASDRLNTEATKYIAAQAA